MGTLTVPLPSIPDSGLHIDATISEEELRPEGVDPLGIISLRITGLLAPMDGEFLFRGLLTGVFAHPCDRCLERVEWPFSTSATWLFEKGPPVAPLGDNAASSEDTVLDDDAPGVIRYQGSVLDLAGPVWEELVLAAPFRILCSDDCKGLCPLCGVNLNNTTCNCKASDGIDKMQNSGLSALGKWFSRKSGGSKKE